MPKKTPTDQSSGSLVVTITKKELGSICRHPNPFEELRRVSALRGLDYNPDLEIHTWRDACGSLCQVNHR